MGATRGVFVAALCLWAVACGSENGSGGGIDAGSSGSDGGGSDGGGSDGGGSTDDRYAERLDGFWKWSYRSPDDDDWDNTHVRMRHESGAVTATQCSVSGTGPYDVSCQDAPFLTGSVEGRSISLRTESDSGDMTAELAAVIQLEGLSFEGSLRVETTATGEVLSMPMVGVLRGELVGEEDPPPLPVPESDAPEAVFVGVWRIVDSELWRFRMRDGELHSPQCFGYRREPDGPLETRCNAYQLTVTASGGTATFTTTWPSPPYSVSGSGSLEMSSDGEMLTGTWMVQDEATGDTTSAPIAAIRGDYFVP